MVLEYMACELAVRQAVELLAEQMVVEQADNPFDPIDY